MSYLLSIDLGTSSVKVGVFASDTLTLVRQATAVYPLHHPQPNFAEQDPKAWWLAVITAVSQATATLDKTKIKAIGLDGQMHGLVCLGKDHQPILPAIIWADGRSEAEVKQLAEAGFTAVLPGAPATGFSASSVLWLKHNQPAILDQTRTILLPKDYIRLRLTGTVASEPSDAASTWLFDVQKNEWAEDVAAFCGLSPHQLPPILASGEIAGLLREETAVQLNLPPNLPVITGAADLAAQMLGHGITQPSQTFVTVGSGGQVVVPQTSFAQNPPSGTYSFPHCLPNRWYTQAAILSAGLSLQWLRDILQLSQQANAYATLSNMAASVPAGADGIIFLPYLSGERTPHQNPQASALFFGLRAHHTTAHLARAVMEGVCFALLDCLNLFEQKGNAPIVLSGGIVQSDVWCQTAAEVWQRPLILTPNNTPRAALGSAVLAGLGINLWSSVEEIKSLLLVDQTIIEPKIGGFYEAAYEKYGRLYPLLCKFHKSQEMSH